jgi:DNA-binding PadR family transcriptional regulator
VPRVPRSNPLALAVLVCLFERPAHPYEVAHMLRERAKHESVRLNYGSLYAVVESLEKRGFIRACGTLRDGRRPERTIYEVTDEGARETLDWLADLVSEPAKEYPQFMAGLSFLAALSPDEALRALATRREALSFKITLLRAGLAAAREAGLPRLFALESEYETAQLASELVFVTSLVAEIADGTLDGLDVWRVVHEGGAVPDVLARLSLGVGAVGSEAAARSSAPGAP